MLPPMSRLTSLAALTAVLLLAMSGLAYADVEVEIGDDGLSPESIQAELREPIVWTNASDATVSLVGEDNLWESGPIEPGATFSIKITEDGTYAYESEDGALAGEIVVGDADAAEPDEADAGEDDKNDSGKGGNDGGKNGAAEVDPDQEALPVTGGADPVVPGTLSVLLIGFGAALLRLTQSRRLEA